jgi:hypothetical protein
MNLISPLSNEPQLTSYLQFGNTWYVMFTISTPAYVLTPNAVTVIQ